VELDPYTRRQEAEKGEGRKSKAIYSWKAYEVNGGGADPVHKVLQSSLAESGALWSEERKKFWTTGLRERAGR